MEDIIVIDDDDVEFDDFRLGRCTYNCGICDRTYYDRSDKEIYFRFYSVTVDGTSLMIIRCSFSSTVASSGSTTASAARPWPSRSTREKRAYTTTRGSSIPVESVKIISIGTRLFLHITWKASTP